MFKILTLFTILSSSFASIKDCDPSSVFRPTQLSISPDPPIPGQSVKLTLVFDNTGNEITDGTATTTLSVNFMPFSPTTKPLCENTACPILSGSNDRSTETTFPDVTGIIKSRVTWTGPEGESLLCLDTSFKISTNNFWDIFSTAKNLYQKNKNDIHSLYYSLKSLAESNNLRGIIQKLTTEKHVESTEDDNY
jgi:hypothetical protein